MLGVNPVKYLLKSFGHTSKLHGELLSIKKFPAFVSNSIFSTAPTKAVCLLAS
jgi:hypothetical protein